jgi:hypothetical protein
MDKNNNFFEIIKKISTGMYCPFCGTLYNGEKINFIEVGNGSYAISFACSKCLTPMVLNMVSKEKSDRFRSSTYYTESYRIPDEAISLNEIIEFHKSIDGFDGDFKKAFKK